jgi:hypothetical protein
MEARIGEAFAGTERLRVIGSRLHPGASAPDSCLSYLDLVERAVHTVRLSDLTGRVRLFSLVNSVQRPVCQVVTRRCETFREALPPEASIYMISSGTSRLPGSDGSATSVPVGASQCAVRPELRGVTEASGISCRGQLS